jgi:hypothetical protein
MWKQDENLRAGLLRDDGFVLLGIDVARGESPGLAIRISGPGVVYIQNGKLRISELNAFTLQCSDGGFCNDEIYAEALQGELAGPTGLAYDEASDTWFVIAGTQLVVVARGQEGAVVKQVAALDSLSGAPGRVEVAVSDGATAVVQSTGDGDSALTFLGCF